MRSVLGVIERDPRGRVNLAADGLERIALFTAADMRG